jgi:chemotaxis-related protein WspB
MLFLLFQLDKARFALEVSHIVDVLPLVAITPMPKAPSCVAGLFNHRGIPVPAIDLSMLALQRPALRRLSTRIVLVHFFADGSGNNDMLGLIAEKATGTMRAEPGDFSQSGVCNAATPYPGPVLFDASGLVRWVDPQVLLPPRLRDMLFRHATASR